MDPNQKAPRVFLSYSWSSPEHQQQVIELAERLMNDGVNVVVDVWDLKPGQDKYAFMEKMVSDPDVTRVLLLCDPVYAAKANSRQGGVGTESTIVSKEIYENAEQRKFIPIIMRRSDNEEAILPVFAESRIYIDLSDANTVADEYEKLLRDIFDQPLRKRPPLGRPPSFVFSESGISPATHLLQNARTGLGRPSEPSTRSKHLFRSIVADVARHQLVATPSDPIDDIVYSKIRDMKPIRDVMVEGFEQIVDIKDEQFVTDELIWLYEELLSLGGQPVGQNVWDEAWSDHINFLTRETWLYLIAVIVRSRAWGVATRLFDAKLVVMRSGSRHIVDCSRVDKYLRSLEEVRNSRLQMRRLSLVADIVKERAGVLGYGFEQLMEADFIMCLRAVLRAANREYAWFPRTLVYMTHNAGRPLPLFVRWRAGQQLVGLRALLGLDTREELLGMLRAADHNGHLKKYRFDMWPLDFFELSGLTDLKGE